MPPLWRPGLLEGSLTAEWLGLLVKQQSVTTLPCFPGCGSRWGFCLPLYLRYPTLSDLLCLQWLFSSLLGTLLKCGFPTVCSSDMLINVWAQFWPGLKIPSMWRMKSGDVDRYLFMCSSVPWKSKSLFILLLVQQDVTQLHTMACLGPPQLQPSQASLLIMVYFYGSVISNDEDHSCAY